MNSTPHPGYDPLGDCGKGKCPKCAKQQALYKLKTQAKSTEINSDGIAPFVGRSGYPNISIGILTPPEHKKDAGLFDAPKIWSKESYDIPSIVNFRFSLINSRTKTNVKDTSKILEISQDVAMASKPAGVDIKLKKVPSPSVELDKYSPPMGPAAELQKAKLTSNPKIHTKIQKTFSDADLKAADAIAYLYNNNVDESHLSKILSVAGFGAERKLVPTRWSITATDDTIGKSLIRDIKNNSQTGYFAYYDSYLGNHYLVLFLSGEWSYELFELYMPKNHAYETPLKHNTDYETVLGRKNYAEDTAGGYYTARLAILEKLKQLKRQATAIAFRFITDEYSMPLGVWVTREAARKSLAQKPIEFSSTGLALEFTKKFIKKKFNYNMDFLVKKSQLLNNKQVKISQFL